jgi:hypothetical protein
MPATLTIRDESLTGAPSREWMLEVLTERLTVRELIRSRVYQEVQDHNLRQGEVFRGLVQPADAEKVLNGWKVARGRQIDWKPQFERAVEAFEKGQILVLINDHQAAALDEEFDVGPDTTVTFLRLTLLVGG